MASEGQIEEFPDRRHALTMTTASVGLDAEAGAGGRAGTALPPVAPVCRATRGASVVETSLSVALKPGAVALAGDVATSGALHFGGSSASPT